MKNVATRGKFVLLLTFFLILGTIFLVGLYAVKGAEWVVFPGSPHLYSGGNLATGTVTDSQGTMLLDSEDKKIYAEDSSLKAATLHLFGDRQGNIGAPMLGHYGDDMVAYNPITGLYALTDKPGQATLSIDGQLQVAAMEALVGYSGTFGMYNYKTGETVVAVTTPTYDPDNVPTDVATMDGVYFNRYFNALYTPGSVFKIVTLAAALENIPDVENRMFTCDGGYTVNGEYISCLHNHGEISLATGFAKSCNVVFGQLAQELGPEVLMEYAEKMGVTKSYAIDGYATKAGIINLTDAKENDIAWAGIGQYTDLINPYGYLQTIGAIANGGSSATAFIMNQINGHDVDNRGTISSGLKPTTCQTIKTMMANNVTAVYGADRFSGFTVCAKSGTAEVGEGLTPHAVFTGFLDDEAYPYAFFILVEHGGSGSDVAGNALAAVLKKLSNSYLP